MILKLLPKTTNELKVEVIGYSVQDHSYLILEGKANPGRRWILHFQGKQYRVYREIIPSVRLTEFSLRGPRWSRNYLGTCIGKRKLYCPMQKIQEHSSKRYSEMNDEISQTCIENFQC